jgi:hypothetical protein
MAGGKDLQSDRPFSYPINFPFFFFFFWVRERDMCRVYFYFN